MFSSIITITYELFHQREEKEEIFLVLSLLENSHIAWYLLVQDGFTIHSQLEHEEAAMKN